MPSPASQAGPAAPTPAAVQLLHYKPRDFVGNELSLRTTAESIGGYSDVQICMSASSGMASFCCWMTPKLARELAVYLVDCANAVDNPAERVILDDTPAWPLKPCQDMGAPRVRPDAGEGIGHE